MKKLLRMHPTFGSIGLPSYPAGHLQTAKWFSPKHSALGPHRSNKQTSEEKTNNEYPNQRLTNPKLNIV